MAKNPDSRPAWTGKIPISEEYRPYNSLEDPQQLMAYIQHRYVCQLYRSWWKVDPGCEMCDAWEAALAKVSHDQESTAVLPSEAPSD